jgi:peptidoglycan hydrolase CwlO-like protein
MALENLYARQASEIQDRNAAVSGKSQLQADLARLKSAKSNIEQDLTSFVTKVNNFDAVDHTPVQSWSGDLAKGFALDKENLITSDCSIYAKEIQNKINVIDSEIAFVEGRINYLTETIESCDREIARLANMIAQG